MLKAINWPKKRAALRENSKIDDNDITNEFDRNTTRILEPTANSNEPTKKSNKLWSLVSSVLRFASLTPNDTSLAKILPSEPIGSDIEAPETTLSPFIIKRCASFAGKYSFNLIRGQRTKSVIR